MLVYCSTVMYSCTVQLMIKFYSAADLWSWTVYSAADLYSWTVYSAAVLTKHILIICLNRCSNAKITFANIFVFLVVFVFNKKCCICTTGNRIIPWGLQLPGHHVSYDLSSKETCHTWSCDLSPPCLNSQGELTSLYLLYSVFSTAVLYSCYVQLFCTAVMYSCTVQLLYICTVPLLLTDVYCSRNLYYNIFITLFTISICCKIKLPARDV